MLSAGKTACRLLSSLQGNYGEIILVPDPLARANLASIKSQDQNVKNEFAREGRCENEWYIEVILMRSTWQAYSFSDHSTYEGHRMSARRPLGFIISYFFLHHHLPSSECTWIMFDKNIIFSNSSASSFQRKIMKSDSKVIIKCWGGGLVCKP